MYKFERYRQLGLADFNQPAGLKKDPNSRWVKKAAIIPRETIEEKYAELFPSDTDMPAKPLRTALGSLMIQKQYEYSNREFRKRLNDDVIMEINEIIIAYNTPDDPESGVGGEKAPTQHQTSRKTAERSFWMQPVPRKT